MMSLKKKKREERKGDGGRGERGGEGEREGEGGKEREREN